MNYLGHLYFSNNDIELMYANLYGDFVKGSKLSNLPEIIQTGTRLHRNIDSYIDSHPLILDLKRVLSSELPKISGIAIDLYFDHWLAKNWNSHHRLAFEEFVTRFYDSSFNTSIYSNPRFIKLLTIMKKDRWLFRYKELEGLEFASTGLSKRISFENSLWRAKDVYIVNQNVIETTFELFFAEAKTYFNQEKT